MTMNRLLIQTVSTLAILVASGAASAQDASTAPTTPAPQDEIVVTGYRASLRDALSIKRNSSVIADIISAEDIGKFPDKNVAEALQRVPGIVINREFGEGERVSLRGTAPNLTRTLLNGHAIATADWFVLDQQSATRSFNYLTLPADIVGQIDVLKSPEADIDEGGLAGTINVHTRRALGGPSLVIAGSGQAVYSDRSGKVDPQFSGLVSWHNAADTFGIVVGGTYEKRQIRRDGVELLGYFVPNGQPTGSAQVPALIGSALFKQDRVRYGGNIGIELKPTETIEVNFTGLYSRFDADNVNENFLAWGSNALGGGGTLTNGVVKNGTVVSGTISSGLDENGNPRGRAAVYDTFVRKAYSEVYSGDLDGTWHVSDRGAVHVQVGYTEAHGNTDAQPFVEFGAPGNFTYDITGGVPTVKFGGGIDPTNPATMVFDYASVNKITNTDRETYLYADYDRTLDLGPIKSIKVGGKYTDHDRIVGFDATGYGAFFVPLNANGCNNGPCSPGFFGNGPAPSDFLNNIAVPGTLTNYFQVNPTTVSNTLLSQPGVFTNRFYYPPGTFSVNEKTYGGFAMAVLGGEHWHGNAGVRVVETDQTSRGNAIGTSGSGSISNPFGNYTPEVVERKYTDILPSLNLSYDVTSKLVARFAAGRAIARPDYTDIVPSLNLNVGTLTATAGNPNVDPYRANQYDVSLEWYPNRDTIVAVAFFYKDILSYIVNSTTTGIYPVQTSNPNSTLCTPGVTGPNPDNLYNCTFQVNQRSNGGGGRNQGVEVQVNKPIWNGFGLIANYTYSDAKANSGAPIPGNSTHSFNLTGYYEKDRISARLSYNYRSDFFIDIDRASPLNQGATESLDASASFRLTKAASLTFDAINLTNDKIFQYSGITQNFRARYDNGSQYYLGARFRY